MKNYGVRFYSGRVGADGNAGKVSDILLDWAQRQADGKAIPQHAAGDVRYELRELVSLNNGASFKGVLAVLRDDAPHIRKADGREEAIPLANNEHVIEKNYFLFYRTNELLVWQVNGRASHISRFEHFMTMLAPATVTFDDVINRSSLDRLEHGTVKRFRLRVARPRNAEAVDPDNWEAGVFELMNGVDGSSLDIEISTRRRGRGLANHIRQIVHRMLDRNDTRALQVRLDGEKEPIDLFADCIKERIDVSMEGLYPVPASAYGQLAQAKDRQQAALDAYFGQGDAVLE